MADANDGGVTCWYDGEFLLTGTHRPFDDGRWEPYIARPRADDDAREERMKAAEAAARVCREDAEANATRAEKADAEVRRLSTRLRTIAQRIIERVGADGPEIAEDALTRLFARIDAETREEGV